MKKRDFIQMVNALSILHPNKDLDGDKIIHWAEARWKRLTARGYGDSKPHTPRQVDKNWYNELSEYQRLWFDKFWNAYGKKQDRNGAAMRWSQMGIPDVEEYQHIVFAAEQEAMGRETLIAQGTTPIHAQGWLNKRRYDDYPRKKDTKAKQTESQRQEKLRDLRGDLAHWAAIDSDFARGEVKKINAALKALENNDGST